MLVSSFLAADLSQLCNQLAHDDMQRFRRNEAQQIRAWRVSLECLRKALIDWPAAAGWELLLEYSLRRLGRRIDAVLVCERAVLVLEFKVGSLDHAMQDRRQVEDYALDLQDFHSLSRNHPIIPILVATGATAGRASWPLLMAGVVTPVLDTSEASLGALLRDLWQRLPEPAAPLDTAVWGAAPYRPVPGIVDAACTLYSRHGVADIASARADAHNLSTTTDAILAAVCDAEANQRHTAIFVTGIPGAGKTLCGLNAVFGTGRESGAIFLTGNPTLVHVLREALARDAAAGHGDLRAARQRTKAAIQALPAFRDSHVQSGEQPPEHVVVIDEAQRAWSAAHAIRKGRDREVKLSDSEPGHLLDIMALHKDWAVLVCLVGNGQEIHDGEGGLAEWGTALAARPLWHTLAAPATLDARDHRQRLPTLANFAARTELHLETPVRSLRNPAAAGWVDAMLDGDAVAARGIASEGSLPFLVTRDLADLRGYLRAEARGLRRAGLVASSGAKRLRADGLGVELPHMEADAVANWFLDRWPDVRASDALEQVATEFSCQGLELDFVGLCWGGDLMRAGGQWSAWRFVGSRWETRRRSDSIANRVNTYRVLLTRARYATAIWIPRGDLEDLTRDPAELDAVADFLAACGALPLAPAPALMAEAETLLL